MWVVLLLLAADGCWPLLAAAGCCCWLLLLLAAAGCCCWLLLVAAAVCCWLLLIPPTSVQPHHCQVYNPVGAYHDFIEYSQGCGSGLPNEEAVEGYRRIAAFTAAKARAAKERAVG